eukprot:15468278-Alexandrium_andersonii.AAC.1
MPALMQAIVMRKAASTVTNDEQQQRQLQMHLHRKSTTPTTADATTQRGYTPEHTYTEGHRQEYR